MAMIFNTFLANVKYGIILFYFHETQPRAGQIAIMPAHEGTDLDTAFLMFLQKSPMNMILFGTATVSGGMLLWPLVDRLLGSSASQVGAVEAVQLINRRDALVLDVRDSADFAAGHLPNARSIPFSELDGRVREIEKLKSKPVIVTCSTGMRSAAVCSTLKKHGFSEVHVLRDGVRGWVEASLPVEKSKK